MATKYVPAAGTGNTSRLSVVVVEIPESAEAVEDCHDRIEAGQRHRRVHVHVDHLPGHGVHAEKVEIARARAAAAAGAVADDAGGEGLAGDTSGQPGRPKTTTASVSSAGARKRSRLSRSRLKKESPVFDLSLLKASRLPALS
jgi:hypothetical protein